MINMRAVKTMMLMLILTEGLTSSRADAVCVIRECFGAEDCHAAQLTYLSCTSAERWSRDRLKRRREEEFKRQRQNDIEALKRLKEGEQQSE